MTRLPHTIVLALPVIALAACNQEATTPTAPAEQPPTLSFAVGSNTWTPKAALPVGPIWLATSMVYDANGNSIVYAFGGIVDGFPAGAIQAYSMATNKWTAKTSTVDYFSTNGVGKIGSKLYFTGGYDASLEDPFAFGHTFAYDYANDRLIKKADMPKATGEGVTGVINNKLYVLPGACSGQLWPDPRYCENENIKTLYRYDAATNTWTTRASAPHYHRSGAAGVINGKFYVVGGSNGVGPSVALDVYDPMMNSWKTLAQLPTPSIAASGAVVGNKLLVVSWFNNGGASPAIRTYSYDPATNKWSAKASPPSLGALTRVALNGKSYVLSVGGSGECCDFEAPSQLYTP